MLTKAIITLFRVTLYSFWKHVLKTQSIWYGKINTPLSAGLRMRVYRSCRTIVFFVSFLKTCAFKFLHERFFEIALPPLSTAINTRGDWLGAFNNRPNEEHCRAIFQTQTMWLAQQRHAELFFWPEANYTVLPFNHPCIYINIFFDFFFFLLLHQGNMNQFVALHLFRII